VQNAVHRVHYQRIQRVKQLNVEGLQAIPQIESLQADEAGQAAGQDRTIGKHNVWHSDPNDHARRVAGYVSPRGGSARIGSSRGIGPRAEFSRVAHVCLDLEENGTLTKRKRRRRRGRGRG